MLIVLFILTLNDVLEISQARCIEIRKNDNDLRRKISAEYQKAHLRAKKQDLMSGNDSALFSEDSDVHEGEPTLHLYYLNTRQICDSESSLREHQGS